MLAVSNTFGMRLSTAFRCCTSLVRWRVRSCSSRCWRSGTKLGLKQPTLQELRYPLRVLHVGLSLRHLLDVLGIDHPDLEMAFEQVEHRLLVHLRRLHRHIASLSAPPTTGATRRSAVIVPNLPSVPAPCHPSNRASDGHHHQLLVHVQSTRPRIQRLQPRKVTLLLAHRRSPFLPVCPGASGLFDSPSRALVGRQRGDNLRRRRMSRITLRVGLSRSTHLSISSLGHRPLTTSLLPHFHPLWASVRS